MLLANTPNICFNRKIFWDINIQAVYCWLNGNEFQHDKKK